MMYMTLVLMVTLFNWWGKIWYFLGKLSVSNKVIYPENLWEMYNMAQVGIFISVFRKIVICCQKNVWITYFCGISRTLMCSNMGHVGFYASEYCFFSFPFIIFYFSLVFQKHILDEIECCVKGKNVMQCNTKVIDSISKDFSTHLHWLLGEKMTTFILTNI